MYNTYPKIDHPCKCCGGSGVQMNKDGIKINCPVCGGTGQQGGSTRPLIWCQRKPLQEDNMFFQCQKSLDDSTFHSSKVVKKEQDRYYSPVFKDVIL